MKSEQTQCFSCFKELNSDLDKKWIRYNKMCPSCKTALGDEQSICHICGSETSPESAILFCKECFDGMDKLA
jgi:rRNA maturation endonuclease Nob1